MSKKQRPGLPKMPMHSKIDSDQNSADDDKHRERQGLRKGDSGTGRPIHKPSNATNASVVPHDKDFHDDRSDEDFDKKRIKLRLPKILTTKVVTSLLIISISILIMFIYSHVISFYREVVLLPEWAQILSFSILGLLIILLIYAISTIVFSYIRLKVNPEIKIPGLKDLEKRERYAKVRGKAARKELIGFIKRFPLDKEKKLKSYGFSKEDIKSLKGAKRNLLDEDLYEGSIGWLNSFYDSFVIILDGVAKREIKKHAILAGVKTALLPNKLFDTIAVLYVNLRMIGALSRIYNLRMTPILTCITFTKAFFHAYLAGEAQDITEDVLDKVTEDIGGQFTSAVLSKIGSKLTEGTINYLFTKRIGVKTAEYLRPLKKNS